MRFLHNKTNRNPYGCDGVAKQEKFCAVKREFFLQEKNLSFDAALVMFRVGFAFFCSKFHGQIHSKWSCHLQDAFNLWPLQITSRIPHDQRWHTNATTKTLKKFSFGVQRIVGDEAVLETKTLKRPTLDEKWLEIAGNQCVSIARVSSGTQFLFRSRFPSCQILKSRTVILRTVRNRKIEIFENCFSPMRLLLLRSTPEENETYFRMENMHVQCAHKNSQNSHYCFNYIH